MAKLSVTKQDISDVLSKNSRDTTKILALATGALEQGTDEATISQTLNEIAKIAKRMDARTGKVDPSRRK
jgi:hypothetical protein